MKRSFVVAIALSLAPAALANGAMYHGFERFHFWPWVADCAVMVALEAWLLGRALGLTGDRR